jgi:hypothetical protein
VKLTTYLHLVPRSRTCGALPPFPIRLHGVMLSYESVEMTLPGQIRNTQNNMGKEASAVLAWVARNRIMVVQPVSSNL